MSTLRIRSVDNPDRSRQISKYLVALALMMGFTSILSAQVVLYDGTNFTGRSITIGSGSISRMRNTDIGNDRLSSIRIAPGYRVIVYEHDYFGGRSMTYSSSQTMLRSPFNNTVSSLAVTRDGGLGWGTGGTWGWGNMDVRMYAQCFFVGNPLELREGAYPTMPRGFNNMLSSIRIPAGMEVDLFTQPNFSGRMVRLRSDEWCVPPEWNNQVSSCRIYRTHSGIAFPDNWNPWDPGNNWGNNNNGNWDNDEARFYENCNYTGRTGSLAPGNYSNAPGWLGESISSVKVPQGFQVILYTGYNFAGYSYTVTRNESCLNNSINNKARSLKIIRTGGNGGGYPPPPPPGGSGGNGNQALVTVYADCNFSGVRNDYPAGQYAQLPPGLSYQISSLRLLPGVKVVVFSGERFNGYSTTITSTTTCLSANWNDKIGSMRVSY